MPIEYRDANQTKTHVLCLGEEAEIPIENPYITGRICKLYVLRVETGIGGPQEVQGKHAFYTVKFALIFLMY